MTRALTRHPCLPTLPTPLHGRQEPACAGAEALYTPFQAEVDPLDHLGRTPLWIAAGNGHLAAARRLLSEGAEVNAADKNGQPPLFAAARGGHLDIVTDLLEYGVRGEPTRIFESLLHIVA